jgi:hypothetical protein
MKLLEIFKSLLNEQKKFYSLIKVITHFPNKFLLNDTQHQRFHRRGGEPFTKKDEFALINGTYKSGAKNEHIIISIEKNFNEILEGFKKNFNKDPSDEKKILFIAPFEYGADYIEYVLIGFIEERLPTSPPNGITLNLTIITTGYSNTGEYIKLFNIDDKPNDDKIWLSESEMEDMVVIQLKK